MLTDREKIIISKMLKNILITENSCTYRNDRGNGCGGPCRIQIDSTDSPDHINDIIEEITGGDCKIIDHDEIIYDDVTAKIIIQRAITAHDDPAIVSDDDIIVEVCDDNGWIGYYWIWTS